MAIKQHRFGSIRFNIALKQGVRNTIQEISFGSIRFNIALKQGQSHQKKE
ncbi:hypothetical protein HMPREF9088_1988 [Enterococcus italicus DSM 15952]|uniref:Uncharacterized protein n=1 Tax=Enterococcus italicus (strain DSM 15952 / CCUG 50447 / LMG 22039 / TP 1.5) TaxID=888064 RepID=E6LHZ8_ENTI1|nr:hypothetical protein HMPREF9088_1988 [Enterococcus italicus DSM 15952]OJG60174.1 hypothetical protein RT43_GL002044 [Enterococcus italicus DSM 15952]